MLQFGGVKGTRFGASPHRSRPQTSQTAAKSAKVYQDACLTPCSSADSKLGDPGVQENRRKRRQPHHAISSATPTAVERLRHSKRTWERGFHCATKQPSPSKHHRARKSVCLPQAFWKRKRRRLRKHGLRNCQLQFRISCLSFTIEATVRNVARESAYYVIGSRVTLSAKTRAWVTADSSQRWAVCIFHVAGINLSASTHITGTAQPTSKRFQFVG